MIQNILTPLDTIGELITYRFEGESLASYRQRLLRVAGVLAHRDTTDERWLEKREEELSARAGGKVRLVDAADDPELLRTAREQLFTYKRLESWSGAFTWPEQGAPGAAPVYNRAPFSGGGVASPSDLVPLKDRQGQYVVLPGYIVSGSALWYVPADLRTITFSLPAGTTETVVLPWQIVSDHPHRIEVISETSLRLVAEDHTHVATLDKGRWKVDGPHSHELHRVEVEGPCFMMASRRAPVIEYGAGAGSVIPARADGLTLQGTAIPVLQLEGVEVETDDGAHQAWVDPLDYWSGRFSFFDHGHAHEVVNWEVQQADDHTHPLTPPDLPEERLLVPVVVGSNGEVFEETVPNPYIAEVYQDRGWTVIRNAYGFSEQLTVAYDVGAVVEVPDIPTSPNMVIGLGPAEPASHLEVLETAHGHSEGMLFVRVRSEDSYTGGVPGQHVQLFLRNGSEVISHIDTYTDEYAQAEAWMPLPKSDEVVLETRLFNAEGVLVESQSFTIALNEIRTTGYGTRYGKEYGN